MKQQTARQLLESACSHLQKYGMDAADGNAMFILQTMIIKLVDEQLEGLRMLESIHQSIRAAHHNATFYGKEYANFKPLLSNPIANWDAYNEALKIVEREIIALDWTKRQEYGY